MKELELQFTIIFFWLYFCLLYPTTEFAPFSADEFLSEFRIDERINFIKHHQFRVFATIVFQIGMPGLYININEMVFYNAVEREEHETSLWRNVLQLCSIIGGLLPILLIYWRQDNWIRHPISKSLRKFSNINRDGGVYEIVADDINAEFRSPNVLVIQMTAINKIIITENWIMKTTPYTVHFAHQKDAYLDVEKSETYEYSQQNRHEIVQMLNICVKSNRPNIPEFRMRINCLNFYKIQDRINCPIHIPSNVQIGTNADESIIERFIEVFKVQVDGNPVYRTAKFPTNKCTACWTAQPNVKLHKQCSDVNEENNLLIFENVRCGNCICRPMWCVECLARWFAAQQNDYRREVWLEKKSPCPNCRVKFCILDVSYIKYRREILR